MDRPSLASLNGAQIVQGLTENIKQASQGSMPHGDRDRCPGIDSLGTARQAIGGGHSETANPVIADMLLCLEDNLVPISGDLNSIIDCRQRIRWKLYIYHRTNDLRYLSFCHNNLLPYSKPASLLTFALSQCRHSPDYIQKLIRNHLLSHLIIGKGKLLNYLLSIIGGTAHCYHSC